jgi:hypothetical protein
MTQYATKYKTTLSQDEDAIVAKEYGREAKPTLFEDKSVEGLIRANCGEKSESGWKRFAKDLIV